MIFDIEKAKKDLTAQTRGGRLVTLLTTEGREPYPIVGYIDDDNFPTAWASNGQSLVSIGQTSEGDLINTPIKREGWVIVDTDCGSVIAGGVFDSLEDCEEWGAENGCFHSRFQVARVAWEE